MGRFSWSCLLEGWRAEARPAVRGNAAPYPIQCMMRSIMHALAPPRHAAGVPAARRGRVPQAPSGRGARFAVEVGWVFTPIAASQRILNDGCEHPSYACYGLWECLAPSNPMQGARHHARAHSLAGREVRVWGRMGFNPSPAGGFTNDGCEHSSHACARVLGEQWWVGNPPYSLLRDVTTNHGQKQIKIWQ